MHSDIAHILVSEEAIRERIRVLGEAISRECKAGGIDEITLIAITNGSIVFAADLMRAIQGVHVRLDSVRVSSYRDETSPISEPEIIDNIRLDIEGAHVIMLDDILDTGKTLQKIVKIIRGLRPASLKTCVLLSKKGRPRVSLKPDFSGFEIPDQFVVGYGLDFAERYRNLPYIGVLRHELQNPPGWK